MRAKLEELIHQLQAVQTHRNWIGCNMQQTLAKLSAEEAFTQPAPGLKSAAELLAHLTLWRTETALKIATGTGSKTDACEENWPSLSTLRAQGWPSILASYNNSLSKIIELLETKNDAFLDEQYYDTDFKGNFPYRFVLSGMLHHDLYHLGQLALTIKYLRSPN